MAPHGADALVLTLTSLCPTPLGAGALAEREVAHGAVEVLRLAARGRAVVVAADEGRAGILLGSESGRPMLAASARITWFGFSERPCWYPEEKRHFLMAGKIAAEALPWRSG
ncbi:hypothetical protein VTH06DRAFT_5392 [Thermothelomyces fergusii]